MISKSIKGILEEFDVVLEQLKNNPETKEDLKLFSSDVRYLKFWRKELESEKHSIFVVGKMSTGKSTFLNFLLDNSNKKEEIIFKVAASTETGLIQTLEHCNSRSESFATIKVKNLREFKKLEFPSTIRYKDYGTVINIPLDNTEQIVFFRDSIIAKSKNNSFDTISAIDQVDIKYPLKYFKNFKIIDTPGLGAHVEKNKETDKNVRTNYQGKSHVFWFLDASKRTMSDNLTLLNEEKELLKVNFKRIHFIANKFDLMDYDDDNKSKNEVIKRMAELGKSITETLQVVLDKKIDSPSIIFTSFKNPNKKFGYHNTQTSIKKLEEQLLLDKKETSYNNISSLISTMKPVLKKLKKHLVEEKKQKLNKKISDLNYQKKDSQKNYVSSQIKKEDVFDVIDRSIIDIKNIKKKNNLNTHEKYNTYINELKKTINTSFYKIDNALKRIDNIDKCNKLGTQLNKLKFIKDISLKKKETLWNRYVKDSELSKKKEDLKDYVNYKIAELRSFKVVLDICIDNTQSSIRTEISNEISMLEEKRKNIEQNSWVIKAINSKLSNINNLLIEDLEVKIYEWSPNQKNENSNFISFLQLYSLLDEHELLMNKIK